MALSFHVFRERAKRAAELRRPGRLGMDFHNHLLPGVDDGIPTFAAARVAIDGLKTAGFTGAVVTPHVYHGVYDNKNATLLAAFRRFVADLHEAGEAFPLQLAPEYFTDEHFLAMIERGDVISLGVADERWVLVEFPFYQETPFAGICVSALAARGYRPVIAHVERYRYVVKAPEAWLPRFNRAGAILQCNIGSLAGQHGDRARRFSQWLAARKLVPLWGTDLHEAAQLAGFINPGLQRLPAEQAGNRLLAQIRQDADLCV